VETEDGRYRASLWARNITNEYYWTSVFAYGNSISRYLGNPRTFGIQLSYRFR
jgi:outer membrane receptor protein involved in Fe transport